MNLISYFFMSIALVLGSQRTEKTEEKITIHELVFKLYTSLNIRENKNLLKTLELHNKFIKESLEKYLFENESFCENVYETIFCDLTEDNLKQLAQFLDKNKHKLFDTNSLGDIEIKEFFLKKVTTMPSLLENYKNAGEITFVLDRFTSEYFITDTLLPKLRETIKYFGLVVSLKNSHIQQKYNDSFSDPLQVHNMLCMTLYFRVVKLTHKLLCNYILRTKNIKSLACMQLELLINHQNEIFQKFSIVSDEKNNYFQKTHNNLIRAEMIKSIQSLLKALVENYSDEKVLEFCETLENFKKLKNNDNFKMLISKKLNEFLSEKLERSNKVDFFKWIEIKTSEDYDEDCANIYKAKKRRFYGEFQEKFERFYSFSTKFNYDDYSFMQGYVLTFYSDFSPLFMKFIQNEINFFFDLQYFCDQNNIIAQMVDSIRESLTSLFKLRFCLLFKHLALKDTRNYIGNMFPCYLIHNNLLSLLKSYENYSWEEHFKSRLFTYSNWMDCKIISSMLFSKDN